MLQDTYAIQFVGYKVANMAAQRMYPGGRDRNPVQVAPILILLLTNRRICCSESKETLARQEPSVVSESDLFAAAQKAAEVGAGEGTRRT